MLVLSRKSGESIDIGSNIKICILRTGGVVRLGIEAPSDVKILRGELDDDGSDSSARICPVGPSPLPPSMIPVAG